MDTRTAVDEVLTTTEAAALLGVTRQRVLQLVALGQLPVARKVSARTQLYLRADVVALAEARAARLVPA